MLNIVKKIKQALQPSGPKIVGHVDVEALEAQRSKEAEQLRKLNDRYSKVQVKIAEVQNQIDAIDARITPEIERFSAMDERRKKLKLRLQYLETKQFLRGRYNNFSFTTAERQKELHFNGIRPESMDVVHFHVSPKKDGTPEMDGVALAMDENHYYIAVDMYDHPDNEDNISTLLDENPDGTFEGIWPTDVTLKKATKFEERFMRQIADKYADDIESARAVVLLRPEAEKDERKTLRASIAQLKETLAQYDKDIKNRLNLTVRLEELRKKERFINGERDKLREAIKLGKVDIQLPIIMEPAAEPEAETHVIHEQTVESELRYPHLAYIRGRKQMEDMSYPYIENDGRYFAGYRFKIMARAAEIFHKVQEARSLTYVLSDEYMEEMKSRKVKYRDQQLWQLVKHGDMASGTLVFNCDGFEDTLLFYALGSSHHLDICYIRNGKLLYQDSYEASEFCGPDRVSYLCPELKIQGVDINAFCRSTRNFILSFILMENDVENTVKQIVREGNGDRDVRILKAKDEYTIKYDEDIIVRDSKWYSSIFVDHIIPVQGYRSHRWCGSGDDKFLREVWVRPHKRNGYHREAGVTKS